MKIINFNCALALAIALVPFQSAHAGKRHSSSKVITILALGDSLTDGFGLTRKEAYPALIADKMRSANYHFEVTNAGVSGDTTADALERLPDLLGKKKIDVLIVALGINDAFRGIPVDQIRSNLQTIIDQTRAQNSSVAVVLAGIQFPFGSETDYVKSFNNLFGSLAEQNHAALVPSLLAGVAANPDLNLPDLIHPNAAGQRILAENIWHVLEPLLQKLSPTPRPK